jgi:hypothetical protein
MKTLAIIFIGVVAVLAITGAGCTQPGTGTPVQTTLTTTVPTTTPVTPVAEVTPYSLVPEPTDVVPPEYSVTVTVEKNTISTDPYIMASFRGGQGLGFVEQMQAIVYTSDGREEQETKDNPQMNTQIVLPGTTGTDRVMVYILLDTGDRYKVIDQDMPFQPINPQI